MWLFMTNLWTSAINPHYINTYKPFSVQIIFNSSKLPGWGSSWWHYATSSDLNANNKILTSSHRCQNYSEINKYHLMIFIDNILTILTLYVYMYLYVYIGNGIIQWFHCQYLPDAYLSAHNVFFDIEYLVSSSLAGLTRCLYLCMVRFIEVTQYL